MMPSIGNHLVKEYGAEKMTLDNLHPSCHSRLDLDFIYTCSSHLMGQDFIVQNVAFISGTCVTLQQINYNL